jgi:WXG100 family type VII secretion target
MTGFVTVPEQLFATRCELTALAERAGEAVARVDAVAGDVFERSWTGAAAAAAGAGYEQWREGAARVVAALAGMADALERAARTYASAEEAGVSALERVLLAA